MHGQRYIPMTYFDSLADARKKLRENSLLALEMQLESVEWLNTARSVVAFQEFAREYSSDQRRSQDWTEAGVTLHSVIKNALNSAPTYYVSPDMCEMVKMAAEEMPSEGLAPNIIPSEKGFLFFSKPFWIDGPLTSLDTPERVPITAVLWECSTIKDSTGKTVPGVSYFLFTNSHDWAVGANHRSVRLLEKQTGMVLEEPILEAIHPDQQEKFFTTADEVKRVFGPIVLYDFSGWAYGKPWNSVPYNDPSGLANEGHFGGGSGAVIDGVHQVHPLVDQARRQLLATWLMLSQTVTTIQNEEPPRYLRRRASRFMPETGDVVIIRLRKEVHDKLSPVVHESVEPWYTHRFLVRGHWKRQPYGPGGTERKLTWISPYIKGPEEAPFVVKDKVFSLES